MSHSEFIEKPILIKMANVKEIESICDLGSGYGMWGLLLRIQNNYNGLIDAVDLYKPWIDRLSKLNIYNNLYYKDVMEFLKDDAVYEKYDLFLCCELIEHLDRDNGLEMIELLKKAKRVIISTPYITTKKLKQNKGYWCGNDLCFHKSGFTPNDFKDYDVTTININYIPKYFRLVFKFREMLTGKSFSEKNIFACRGFD